ncbi:MAG: hypothetical protein AB7S26_36785 [Sandaracinaceae bacterium]
MKNLAAPTTLGLFAAAALALLVGMNHGSARAERTSIDAVTPAAPLVIAPDDTVEQDSEVAPADPLQGGSCGDGRCQPPEDCHSCEQDCGSCCGDHHCAPPEDCRSCPQDCC